MQCADDYLEEFTWVNVGYKGEGKELTNIVRQCGAINQVVR